MLVGITGATGFVGRYIVEHLLTQGHRCRCWYRPTSDRGGFGRLESQFEWVRGELGDRQACEALVANCDAVVHSALHHPGGGFHSGEGDLVPFVQRNIVGTLELIEAAQRASVGRIIFISTCAVHEKILDNRPLDEAHPLWPTSHYGAHKAAIEAFVHSYGYGMGYPICALRPTGVYGLARSPEDSKWFELVRAVARGQDVTCRSGGKEVHAADVAKAVGILLSAEGIAGESYACYDRYVSENEVASIAKRLSGSRSAIHGAKTSPKHQIATQKLRSLGMEFGGDALLEKTIGQLVDAVKGRRPSAT